VQQGGSIVATGQTSRCDEWGDPRPDFALADLFKARVGSAAPETSAAGARGSAEAGGAFAPSPSGHTYLRLTPELRSRVDGPHVPGEPAPAGTRHAVLRGFDETDILAYGGTLSALRVDPGTTVPLTFIPPFPTYPPETAWMREERTDIPGLVLSEQGASRVGFMPADIDRRYALEHLPDHATLLANVTRWAVGDRLPIEVDGPGLIDCHLYEQPSRLILHLVILTSEATWRAPLDELIPVGPFTVKIRVPSSMRRPAARLLVSGGTRAVTLQNGMATLTISSILDHEVIVLG